jgi:hypothetical protein
MPPEVLILTSFRQQVAVVRQQVAVVRQQVAVVRQQVAVVRQQVAVVRQQAFVPLQAVQQAFAGKKLLTELCLPLQVAIAFSSHLPPNEFCS